MHFSAIWPLPPPFLHRKKGTARPPFSSFPPSRFILYTPFGYSSSSSQLSLDMLPEGRKGGEGIREFKKRRRKLINKEGQKIFSMGGKSVWAPKVQLYLFLVFRFSSTRPSSSCSQTESCAKNTVLFRYLVQNTLEKYIDPLLLPNEEPVEYFHPWAEAEAEAEAEEAADLKKSICQKNPFSKNKDRLYLRQEVGRRHPHLPVFFCFVFSFFAILLREITIALKYLLYWNTTGVSK